MYELMDLNECQEREAMEKVYKEFEQTLKRNEEFNNYLHSLQSLIGEGAIIKYRKKGGDLEKRDEWIIRRT